MPIYPRIEKPVFALFKINPENFISEAARLLSEQKATAVIEHLTYDVVNNYDKIMDIVGAASNDPGKRL